MITKTQNSKMKKLFKNGYTKEIQLILEAKNVVSKKGIPFGESYITHVFNGRNSNDEIEDAFLELYQNKLKEVADRKLRRKQIFENKKPEAGTSGQI